MVAHRGLIPLPCLSHSQRALSGSAGLVPGAQLLGGSDPKKFWAIRPKIAENWSNLASRNMVKLGSKVGCHWKEDSKGYTVDPLVRGCLHLPQNICPKKATAHPRHSNQFEEAHLSHTMEFKHEEITWPHVQGSQLEGMAHIIFGFSLKFSISYTTWMPHNSTVMPNGLVVNMGGPSAHTRIW